MEIYCDATYMEGSGGLAGVLVKNSTTFITNQTFKCKGQGSTQCEIEGLEKAFRLAKQYKEAGEDVTIFSDSKEAISAFQSRANKHGIKLRWIKAHQGRGVNPNVFVDLWLRKERVCT